MTSAAPVATVLLVEPDLRFGHFLHQGLDAHGYETVWMRTGEDAALQLRKDRFQVVLLSTEPLGSDLPGSDSVQLAQTVRTEHPDTALIIMTAGVDPPALAEAFTSADAYLIRPFNISALLAQLRAHRRRPSDRGPRATTPAAAGGSADRGILGRGLDARAPNLGAGGCGAVRTGAREDAVIGGLRLRRSSRQCWLAGVEVPLRPKEFDLLAALAVRANRSVNRQDLISEVWGGSRAGSPKVLSVTMASLRKALASCSSVRPVLQIITLRSYGYRLEVPHGFSLSSSDEP